MKSGREELRRGVREILEGASQDLESLMSTPVPPPEERRPPIPEAVLPEMPAALPKKGLCQAYFINKRCWEVPEAFCNTALQVCMTRECPIYHLYKEEMERRFAAKFAHFW